MSSPFDDSPQAAVVDRPQPKPESPFAETSVTEEAKTLLRSAIKLESQVNLAKKTRDSVWMSKLGGVAVKLGYALTEFAQHALVLAIVKFVWEFCAMILNGLSDYLFKKNGQKMEFTTPGINCFGSRTPPPAAQATSSESPFRSYYGPAW